MKRFLLTLALLFCSAPAAAEFVIGGGYLSVFDDDSIDDFTLGGIYASVGYAIEGDVGYTFMPEVRLGAGVADDTVVGVDIELDSFLALGVRGQYNFDSGFYLFAAPAFSRFEFEASAFGVSLSEDEWEFGLGGGAGYKLEERFWAEASYEVFDTVHAFSLGLKFSFQ